MRLDMKGYRKPKDLMVGVLRKKSFRAWWTQCFARHDSSAAFSESPGSSKTMRKMEKRIQLHRNPGFFFNDSQALQISTHVLSGESPPSRPNHHLDSMCLTLGAPKMSSSHAHPKTLSRL